MDLSMVKMQLCILLMLIAGFACGKAGLFSTEGRKALTNIFTKVVLPCNVLSSFCTHVPLAEIKSGLPMILIYSLVLLCSWLIGKLLFKNAPQEEKNIYIYAALMSNAHFLGFPVVEALWGSKALIYASMALIPIVFFSWTLGLGLFVMSNKKDGVKAFLTHPCFIALIIGLILTAFQTDIPGPAAEAITRFGGCVMPFSVLLIGSNLSEINLGGIFRFKNILSCSLRLLIIPFLTLLILHFFRVSEEITRIVVVMVGMPVAMITAVLAEQYHADTKSASQLVFLSTVGSLFTLPVLYLFF